MTRKHAGISKTLVIVLAAFCLPLAACSQAAGGNTEVAMGANKKGKHGLKAAAASTSWFGGKAKDNIVGAAPKAGAKVGGGGGRTKGVKIPKIGGNVGKKGV